MNYTEIIKTLKNEIIHIQDQMNIEYNAYCNLPLNERDENKHHYFINAWINQKRGIEKAIEIINNSRT